MNPIDPATLPLKGIHFPTDISWWPLAMGWWILILFLLLTTYLAYYFCRKGRLKRAGLHALKAIKQQKLTEKERIQQLSALLRRISLCRYSKKQVAGLTGEKWLAWLDKPLKKKEFSQGAGQILITAPYQNTEPDKQQLEALFLLIKKWIKTKDD